MRRVKKLGWRGRIVLVLAGATIGFLFWTVQSRTPDPLIEGQRMSAWAVTLLDQSTNFHQPYAYSRKHRRVFAENRELAIPHLIAAVRYPTEFDRARIKVSRNLPAPLARFVKPDRRPLLRWLGVLALSDLARVKPDPRIPVFFLECMKDERDHTLRKIAAYEAGPWLQPGGHGMAIQILRLALGDEDHLVRRDACRRIAESARRKDTSFTSAAKALSPLLEKIRTNDPALELRAHAKLARQQLQ